jgi:hypothetical protein
VFEKISHHLAMRGQRTFRKVYKIVQELVCRSMRGAQGHALLNEEAHDFRHCQREGLCALAFHERTGGLKFLESDLIWQLPLRTVQPFPDAKAQSCDCGRREAPHQPWEWGGNVNRAADVEDILCGRDLGRDLLRRSWRNCGNRQISGRLSCVCTERKQTEGEDDGG